MQRLTHVVWEGAWHLAPRRFPQDDSLISIGAGEPPEVLKAIDRLTRDNLFPIRGGFANAAEAALLEALGSASGEASWLGDGTFACLEFAADFEIAMNLAAGRLERFLGATDQRAMEIDLQARRVDIDGHFVDLTALGSDHAAIRQALKQARLAGQTGVLLRVIHGGRAVIAFTPDAWSHAREDSRFAMSWNGREVETAYEKRLLRLVG
ncbi:MAG: hypothetical protein ACFB6S_17030 [Geminicoccaceae bacterium]